MISATAPQLITTGALLVICSFIFPSNPQKLRTVGRKIIYALAKVMRLVGFAALIAATIILLIPALEPSDLTTKTLKELNETIEQYHRWLEMSWTVLLVLIASLLVCFWLGWSELTAAHARLAGRVVKATSTPKLLVGLLASCTFIGAGIEERTLENTAKTEAVAQRLAGLQLQLFSHIEREIERELIEEVITQAATQSPQFKQTVTAFNIVAPFLPNRPDITRVADDKILQDTSLKVAVPDISLAQAEKIERELNDEEKKEGSPDIIIENFIHLAYDKGVSDSIKLFLRHIGNPFISELVADFLDPFFGEQAERLITTQATKVMQNHFDRKTSQAQLRAASQPLHDSIARRLAAVQQPTQDEENLLGDPRWDYVRTVLRRVIMIGLPGKMTAVQDDARAAMRRFDYMWSALDILVKDSQERRDQSERIFSAYIKQNADLAALWGFFVISVTPSDYQSDLVNTAQQIGPPDDVLTGLTKLVRMREEGNEEAKKAMEKFDPENELTSLSGRSDYARIWYMHHGPYPLHGYVLYEKVIGGSSTEKAVQYFRSEPVTDAVNKYCRNNRATSAD